MFAALVGLVGLLVGPFLSAIVDSVPDYSGGGRAFNTCETCGSSHGVGRFVPILGARPCRTCSTPMRATSLLVQITTALAFAGVAARMGPKLELLPVLGLVAALIALSAIDIERYRLPDRLLFPALGVLLVAIVVVSPIAGVTEHLVPALVGAVVYFMFLLVPNLISPGGLAFGDVKLALLLGLFLGWARASVVEGVVLVVYALLLGMILGLVTGLAVGVSRRIWGPDILPDPDVPESERVVDGPILKTQFPFGPALAASAVTVMMLSSSIIGSPGLV